MKRALDIGLTGGIGSGKSTVARMLATRGFAIVDADAISRKLTQSGGRAIDAIRQAFGGEFITAQDALDRDRMRQAIFSDAGAKARLEAIIHPLIQVVVHEQAQAARSAGEARVLFDIPLLVESGSRWRERLDAVWVVDCAVETQVARVMTRNGLAREAVLDIVAAQAPRAVRLAAADAVIHNDGLSLEELQTVVETLSLGLGL
ncbi:MAG TPA: dephospho-CoA kinase [Burkholderiaceae bacterium]|nr:dephospho-CoA kinase [Burkholderiaceae bacterium]